MRDNFQKALGFALRWEGYKTDDPRDPGKLTIWGWSSVYHPVEVATMARMSKEDALKYASDLYREKYWTPFKCDSLPYPQDIIVFDISINPGAKLVGLLRGDWKDYLFQRISYYRELVKKAPYKRIYYGGWINRTLDLYNLVR